MTQRKAQRIYRELTPAENARLAKARQETAAEKDLILARGRYYKQLRDQRADSSQKKDK